MNISRRHFLNWTIGTGLAVLARQAEAGDALRVGLIGHTGRGNYGHFLDTMWLRVAETEIVAIADADAPGLAKAQKKLKVAKGFADYRKMLAEIKPDIVTVCPRYLDQHRDMALAAIEAGARGVYVEKPFCRTPAEADEIVAACKRRGVACAVAHRNRYHPVLPVLARLVQDGRIGRLLEIRCRGKEDERGGPEDLWVLGCHLFNLAHYFAGRPLACSGMLLQDGQPATRADVRTGPEGIGPIAGREVHVRFEMEHGVPVFFASVVKAGRREAGFGLQLIGTQGIIDLRPDDEPLAHLMMGSPFTPTGEARVWTPITTAGVGQPEPILDLSVQVLNHVLPARDLIGAMRQQRPPLCSAEDGRVAVEMISAVFESHRLGGQRVTWPLKTRQNPLTQL